jgi:hypothetical protein
MHCLLKNGGAAAGTERSSPKEARVLWPQPVSLQFQMVRNIVQWPTSLVQIP